MATWLSGTGSRLKHARGSSEMKRWSIQEKRHGISGRTSQLVDAVVRYGTRTGKKTI